MDESVFFTLPEPGAFVLWGLGVIKAIQGIQTPAFTTAMGIASYTAVVIIFLAVLIIYWCIDAQRGARLGIVLIISSWINMLVKSIVKMPRPFSFDSSLGMIHETGYSFPSGHSQMTFTLFFLLAYWICQKLTGNKLLIKKLLIWIISSFIILLVGFSRIYLGVHFPVDVLFGFIAGGLIVGLFIAGDKKITSLLETGGKRGQLIIAALTSLVMMYAIPDDPRLSALFLGFVGGYAFQIKEISFFALGSILEKKSFVVILLLRFISGVAVTALLYFGLVLLFPGEKSIFSNVSWWGSLSPYIDIGIFLRHGLVGFWISAGAPLLFGLLKLADNKETASELPVK